MQYSSPNLRRTRLTLAPALPLIVPLVFALACAQSSPGPDSGAGGGGSGGTPGAGGNGSGGTSAAGAAASGAAGRSAGGASQGGGTATGGSATGGNATGGNAGGGTGGSATGGNATGGNAGGGTSSAGGAGGGGQGGGSTRAGGASGSAGGAQAGGNDGGAGSATGGASGGAAGNSGGAGGVAAGAWLKCSDLTSTKLASEYGAWNKAFVVACGTDKARVQKGSTTSVSNTTVSEGVGYGMLIAAGMRDCDLLKKLHRFYLAAQSFTNNPANAAMKGNGLMPWSLSNGCDTNTVDDANFASDGDLDAAMGLLQGSVVCSDQGSYDYKAGAVTIINALKKNAFLTSNGKTILKGGGVGTAINPSYFAVGYFNAFAKAVPADATFWLQARSDAYTLLASYQSASNGKFPDWGNADGSPAGSWGYDACRVPWRIATDYAWTAEPNAKTLLATFRTTGMGGQLPYAATDQHNSAFVGSMALTAIGADQATMDAFCTDWLKRTTTSGGELDDSQYYQGTLRLVYMMLASGMAVSTL